MTNQTHEVIALIPARSGSKGIPNKNIKKLLDKPLIGYSIEESLKTKGISRVIVSTDSQEIASIAKNYGAEVPFIRPPELALDTTPGIDPVLHCLKMLPEAQTIVLLQPTSPLRNSFDIAQCLEIYRTLGIAL